MLTLLSRISLVAFFPVAASCALVAGLGQPPERAELPADTTPSETEALAPDDGLAADRVPDDGAPNVPDPAIVTLRHPTYGTCTGAFVGPATILTAASCFAEYARGCEAFTEYVKGWHAVVRTGNGTVTLPVDGFAVAPLAYGNSTECGSGNTCAAAAANPRIGLRRSHDVALVHVETKGATNLPPPLRVLTRSDDPTTSSVAGVHALIAASGPPAAEASLARATADGISAPTRSTASFATSPHWRVSCEARWSCAIADPRDGCPPLPVNKTGFFNDVAMRVRGLDLAKGLGPARGAPVLIKLGSQELVIGVASDHVASETYIAPTFDEEVGPWLDRRFVDFDDDCLMDGSEDSAPTAKKPGSCPPSLLPAKTDENDILTWKPMVSTWSRNERIIGSPALASWSADRLDIFVRATDDRLHHVAWRGWADGLLWSAWEDLDQGRSGGPHATDVGATSWAINHLLVGASTFEGGLKILSHTNPSSWATWQPTGVAMRSPIVLVAVQEGWAEGFFRQAGTLWRIAFHATTGWSVPVDTGIAMSSEPTAVLLRGRRRISVVARASAAENWRLLHYSLSIDSGIATSEIIKTGALPGRPNIADFGAGRIFIYVRGSDAQLRRGVLRETEPRWTDFVDEGGTWTSDPATISWGPGRVDIVGRGGMGELRHRVFEE